MSDTAMLIAMTEAKGAVKAADPLEDRLRAAMHKTYRHWMVTDEDTQFRAAVGAVMLSATDEENDRLKSEMRNLRAISAAISGIPIDFGALSDQHEPVGLLRMWDEIKAESTKP